MIEDLIPWGVCILSFLGVAEGRRHSLSVPWHRLGRGGISFSAKGHRNTAVHVWANLKKEIPKPLKTKTKMKTNFGPQTQLMHLTHPICC